MTKDWKIVKLKKVDRLFHFHKENSYPCYKIDDKWLCRKCNKRFTGNTKTSAPVAQLYTKDKTKFNKCKIALDYHPLTSLDEGIREDLLVYSLPMEAICLIYWIGRTVDTLDEKILLDFYNKHNKLFEGINERLGYN